MSQVTIAQIKVIGAKARKAGARAAYEFFCDNMWFGEFPLTKWKNLDEGTQEKWAEMDDAYTQAFLDAYVIPENYVPAPSPESNGERVYELGKSGLPVLVKTG
jgi:hypothetical protein